MTLTIDKFSNFAYVATTFDAYAEAAEETLLCVMSSRDAGKFILSRPNVALLLLRVIGNRLRELAFSV